MPSFEINPNAKKGSERDNKIQKRADAGGREGEIAAKMMQKKGKGPSLPGRTADMRKMSEEEVVPGIKLVDIILGEEKCGKGMYYCYTDKKCKKLPEGMKMTARYFGGGKEPSEVGIDKPVEGGEGGDNGGNGGGNGGGMGESIAIEDAFGNKFMEVVDLIKPEDIVEKCWKGYKKKGMKTMFGKRYPNCVKANEENDLPEAAPKYDKDGNDKYDRSKRMIRHMQDKYGSAKSGFGPDSKFRTGKDHSVANEKKMKKEEVEKVDEAVRLQAEYGNLLGVVVMWRGRSLMIKMFFPQASMPKREDVQREIEKVYPGGKVIQFRRTELPSDYSPHNAPIVRVQKEDKDEMTIHGSNLKKLAHKATKRVDSDVDGDVDSSDMKKSETGEFVTGPDGKKVKAKARFEGVECAGTPKGKPCPVHGQKCCPSLSEEEVDEAAGEKDACYHKVKSRYSVWPSAYASGALVKCRKKGAKNWGNKTKKEEYEYELNEGWVANTAAKAFVEEGLNEDGVAILIEEMGLDSFVEFVYDLGEDTMLSEARAGGVRVEPVTKGGKAVGSLKGGPKAAAIKRLRKEKQVRKDAESGSSKPSGMKAALKGQSDRVKAVKSAKSQQPKKRGLLDKVAKTVLDGMDRHNKAMKKAKGDIETTKKVAKKAGKAAKSFGSGFVSGVKTAGKAAKAGYKMATEEEDRRGK